MLSSLILYNNQPFLNWIVTCEKKVDFIWWPVTTSSVAEPRRRPKALPKAKLGPKKCHDHSLVICCQPDTLQLSESQQNHYIWEVCSANQWDAPKTATAAAGIGQQKGPSPSHLTTLHVTQPVLQKLNKLDYVRSFASSVIFTWPLANLGLPLLQASQQLFAGKMLPQPAGGRKCFPRVHQISKQRLFTLQEKTNLFLAGKNVLIVSS